MNQRQKQRINQMRQQLVATAKMISHMLDDLAWIESDLEWYKKMDEMKKRRDEKPTEKPTN